MACIFLQALWTRFFPLYVDIKNLIDSNALGEFRLAFVSFGSNATHVERVCDRDQGGGVLLDIGLYCLHVVDMIFNEEPLTITAVGQKMATGVDSTVVVTMLYEREKTASITMSVGEYKFSDMTDVGLLEETNFCKIMTGFKICFVSLQLQIFPGKLHFQDHMALSLFTNLFTAPQVLLLLLTQRNTLFQSLPCQ